MSLAAAERARTTADAMAVVDDRQELSWAALDPILLEHRDRIYQRHIKLPMDF